jgi:hypothetical protein
LLLQLLPAQRTARLEVADRIEPARPWGGFRGGRRGELDGGAPRQGQGATGESAELTAGGLAGGGAREADVAAAMPEVACGG